MASPTNPDARTAVRLFLSNGADLDLYRDTYSTLRYPASTIPAAPLGEDGEPVASPESRGGRGCLKCGRAHRDGATVLACFAGQVRRRPPARGDHGAVARSAALATRAVGGGDHEKGHISVSADFYRALQARSEETGEPVRRMFTRALDAELAKELV